MLLTLSLSLHAMALVPEPPKVTIEGIREFVLEKASLLESVLLGDREAAKQALRRHFKPLVLSPKETTDGAVFTVQGGLDLFSGLPDVGLLVAPLCSEPQAETMCKANLPLAVSNERRSTLPSTATTPCNREEKCAMNR